MKPIKMVWAFWLGLALVLWAVAPPAVWAHGGGVVRVAGEVAGPYRLTVWVAPNTIEAGNKLHFTVAVVQPEGSEPVLDAEVWVDVLVDGTDTAVLSGPATTAQAVNKLFYEVDFQAPADTGRYQVRTHVSGAEGEGTVTFDLTVAPARPNLLLYIGLGGVLLVTALGIFFARRGEKAATAD